MTTSPWLEVGPNVFARRYEFFDQQIGAVVGPEAVLVIDTRTTFRQARELRDDLRRLTPLPWIVLNTHHHFDHTFGNGVFRPCAVWGHERCAWRVANKSEATRARLIREAPELAEELAEVELSPPENLLGDFGVIDVGGRSVECRHLGLAHTDNDLVVTVPDCGVAFAGDLIEVGAPPSFGDSYPLDWPATLEAALPLFVGSIVPGHGDVVDRSFVEGQLEEIRIAAEHARAAHDDGRTVEQAANGIGYPFDFARFLAERVYLQLEGTA
jgi:glyoxylase-like metal-dependent hydrolase (beta-lactamase superfamily II)